MKKILTLVAFLAVTFALQACSNTTTETTTTGLQYDMFDSITDYDEIFNRREGDYLVYLYQTDCVNCLAIKDTVLAFADTYTAHAMYFFNVGGLSSEYEAAFLETVGETSSSFGTPTLIVVTNNSFDATAKSHYYFVGKLEIPAVLRDLKNNAYSYWK